MDFDLQLMYFSYEWDGMLLLGEKRGNHSYSGKMSSSIMIRITCDY